MIPPSLPTKPSINLSFARKRTPGDKGGEMSRQLPPQSNLEYLKKQVKDLLRDMRQRDPAYNLTDALAAHLAGRGAAILEAPVLREYRAREVVVSDCNGLIIALGENLTDHVT